MSEAKKIEAAYPDLKLSLHGSYDAGDKRHAQVIMESLGIAYLYAVPQSISDAWWFFGCENIPEELPGFITEIKRCDPHEFVGYGLSKEMAGEIVRQRRLREGSPV